MKRLIAGAAIAVATMAANPILPAQAGTLTVFDNKDDFLMPGITATAPLPNLGNLRPTRITHDNLTFTGSLSFKDRTPLLPGIELAISGVENFDVEIANAVNAFGFDFVEPTAAGAPFFESTFDVTLFDGATEIGAFEFERPNDVVTFVGVASDESFNRVEIRDRTNTIDNEFFGTFYTGTETASTPDPSAILGYLGLTVIGAGLRMRHSQKSAHDITNHR